MCIRDRRCSGCCEHDQQVPPVSCNGKGKGCNPKVVTEKITLSSAPRIMFVRLNRSNDSVRKLTNLIQLEDVLKMPGGEEYTPTVIISHYGKSVNNGHYIAFVKNDSGHWWQCDDAATSQSSLHDATTKDNYLIVFRLLQEAPILEV